MSAKPMICDERSEITSIQCDQRTVKRVRHALSSSISFLETSVKNLASPQADTEKALRIHAMGMEKLRNAIRELDGLIDSSHRLELFESLSVGLLIGSPEIGKKHETS